MLYIIGFGMRGKRSKVSTAERATAAKAAKLVHDLRMSDEEIKFIKADGREISEEELKMYADGEGRK